MDGRLTNLCPFGDGAVSDCPRIPVLFHRYLPYHCPQPLPITQDPAVGRQQCLLGSWNSMKLPQAGITNEVPYFYFLAPGRR